MERHAFAMKVKEGQKAAFRSGLGNVWPELTEFLDKKKIVNFSIWNAEDMVFGYYETEDGFAFTEEDKALAGKWEATYGGSFTWVSAPFEEMRLMYHDFGYVRQSKELIRHRVFITKLVPGAEEEYKARHDVLVDARNGVLTEGPDSNFSIWYAGGYIFGYDEIDITMEKDRTKADDDADIAWETRMFEIMSWITNDVDWISKEHHDTIKRIAHHN